MRDGLCTWCVRALVAGASSGRIPGAPLDERCYSVVAPSLRQGGPAPVAQAGAVVGPRDVGVRREPVRMARRIGSEREGRGETAAELRNTLLQCTGPDPARRVVRRLQEVEVVAGDVEPPAAVGVE